MTQHSKGKRKKSRTDASLHKRASRREHVASGPGPGVTPQGERSPLRGGRYSRQPRAPAERCAAPGVHGQPGREGLGSDAGASRNWSRPATRRQWPLRKGAVGGASSPATWAQVRPLRLRRRTWAPRDRPPQDVYRSATPASALKQVEPVSTSPRKQVKSTLCEPWGLRGAAGPGGRTPMISNYLVLRQKARAQASSSGRTDKKSLAPLTAQTYSHACEMIQDSECPGGRVPEAVAVPGLLRELGPGCARPEVEPLHGAGPESVLERREAQPRLQLGRLGHAHMCNCALHVGTCSVYPRARRVRGGI
ncbi:unnamed protein product [Rangifer tarandus platyrhynchus]|uniref:Uncharacterized protein n=1 Tax=Rangifer tarandus platyrhynchus TaxID=3082113 RepID=A0AC59YPY0_RANTA